MKEDNCQKKVCLGDSLHMNVVKPRETKYTLCTNVAHNSGRILNMESPEPGEPGAQRARSPEPREPGAQRARGPESPEPREPGARRARSPESLEPREPGARGAIYQN